MRLVILFGVTIFLCSFYSQQQTDKVSLHMVNKTLKNGKVLTVESDIFYKGNERKMLTNYSRPLNYIMINTATGESQIYNPDKNEVQLLQHDFLKTGNSLLYFFFTNQLQNLGMKEAGYKLTNTNKANHSIISIFQPITENKSGIVKVEMVHENSAPVYAAFYNSKGWISRKIYYSGYHNYENFLLPGRITEISFSSPGDSVISRTIISDVKTGRLATSEYFEFEVPAKAKIVK